MTQRERLLAGLLLAALAAAIIWSIFGFDWLNEGGQYRQIGEQLSQRHPGVRAADYKYVGNSSTKQYWPNRAPYSTAVPAGNRVFILDDEALAGFRGYRRGPN